MIAEGADLPRVLYIANIHILPFDTSKGSVCIVASSLLNSIYLISQVI
jgi:hypothetical protein